MSDITLTPAEDAEFRRLAADPHLARLAGFDPGDGEEGRGYFRRRREAEARMNAAAAAALPIARERLAAAEAALEPLERAYREAETELARRRDLAKNVIDARAAFSSCDDMSVPIEAITAAFATVDALKLHVDIAYRATAKVRSARDLAVNAVNAHRARVNDPNKFAQELAQERARAELLSRPVERPLPWDDHDRNLLADLLMKVGRHAPSEIYAFTAVGRAAQATAPLRELWRLAGLPMASCPDGHVDVQAGLMCADDAWQRRLSHALRSGLASKFGLDAEAGRRYRAATSNRFAYAGADQ